MNISSHPYSMATIPHKIKAKIMTWTKHRSSILCGQLNAWLGVNRCEHFRILKKTKKGQCFRLFSTLKNIKICLIWRMFTFFRNVNIRQIKQIFIFFNVENSRKHCPFFKILKCSHLFTPSHAFSWPMAVIWGSKAIGFHFVPR